MATPGVSVPFDQIDSPVFVESEVEVLLAVWPRGEIEPERGCRSGLATGNGFVGRTRNRCTGAAPMTTCRNEKPHGQAPSAEFEHERSLEHTPVCLKPKTPVSRRWRSVEASSFSSLEQIDVESTYVGLLDCPPSDEIS